MLEALREQWIEKEMSVETKAKAQTRKWKRETKEGNRFKAWEQHRRNKMIFDAESHKEFDPNWDAISFGKSKDVEDRLIAKIDAEMRLEHQSKEATARLFKKGSKCNP